MLRASVLFCFGALVCLALSQSSSGRSSSGSWTSGGSSTGGVRCGGSFCGPNTKCARCTDGSEGCFDYNMYGTCCSCRAGSNCWACPRASQCNVYRPNWCNSTCSSSTRCQFGYNCQVCLDGTESCFPASQAGVCCGCINGRCWQCKYSYQCNPNNPGYCVALKREASSETANDYELAEGEWEEPQLLGTPSNHL